MSLTSLLSAGNSGGSAPVSDDHTGAAHTQRAASAGLLQLHVRHTAQACLTSLTMHVLTLPRLPLLPSVSPRSLLPSG